jgi:hypothetical protein
VGDLDKPKLVFFFDEAHLLFNDAPKPLQKIEQVVRLIRSKGVGVYFVTQNPLDIPDTVLGQLGNRVQHALRAFTRATRRPSGGRRNHAPNPMVDTAQAITELGVGEALVSFLDEGPAQRGRARLCADPASQIGPITAEERRALIASSLVAGVYEQAVDRESAYERLKGRAVQQPQAARTGPGSRPAPLRRMTMPGAHRQAAAHRRPPAPSRPSGGARCRSPASTPACSRNQQRRRPGRPAQGCRRWHLRQRRRQSPQRFSPAGHGQVGRAQHRFAGRARAPFAACLAR